jgi:PAS domain S-box-containing protein
MPNLATVRERRLRKTKAQLIDEIDSFERRVVALEVGQDGNASRDGKPPSSDDYLANQALLDLAKFPSENPNPVLRVTPKGGLLYANAAAQAVKGLLTGSKKNRLPSKLAKVTTEVSRTAAARQPEFHSGDQIFALALTPVAGESYINIYGRDITDRKRAEQAATEAQALLNDAIDCISEGFALYAADDRLVLCNKTYRDLWGYTDTEAAPGVHWDDLDRLDVERGTVIAEGSGIAGSPWRAALSRRRQRQSVEIQFSDGRWVTIRDRKTADGGSVSIQTDITELKRAERELAEKSAVLEVTLENMEQGISMFDAELNAVALNRKYFELLDFPEDEFGVGDSLEKFFRFNAARGEYGPGDADAQVAKQIALARKSETHQFERTRPNGTVIELRRGPVEGGGFVTTYTDITERKRAEEAIREQTKIVELLHRAASDANRAENVEEALQGCLDAVCAHTGWPVGHVYVRSTDERDKLLPTKIWHFDGSKRFAEFRKITERTTFEPGVGLPGRVLASGKSAWITDVTEDPNFPRAKLAKDIGVRAGFAVPVLAETDVVAVLEFFSPEAVEPDEGLLNLLDNVGGQVGRVFERKRAEEELAGKEAQLRVALDNMPGGMALFDRDLNFVLFNSQNTELFEYPDGLVRVGVSHRDVLRYQADRGDFGPGDKDNLIEQAIATFQRGEAVSFEREIAGSGRTLQVYLGPTPEGGYVTIATDITERKRAEEALLKAKRRSEEASELVAEKNRMLESLSNQLSKYLSPQVYASIFSGEQSVEIASKRKKLTVFFSDIADFTGTTDSLESEELTNLLNHYLTEMSKIALDFGATIDKYVGDAIIAFFGDPETRGVKEDARACVNMAIAMQRRMRELQSEWLDMGLEKPFELRIGINTGFCTVGNFGSEDRMDYTIIGNEVNLAARLETHAEVGGILLAHETHSLIKDTVMAEEGDTLTVKGFARPVRTYSVVGL